MRSASQPLAMAMLVAGAWGCSKDNFVRPIPAIEVAAHTNGQAYQKVEQDGHLIHLGEVPMYSTARAIFRVSNNGSADLEIQSVTYAERVGVQWHEPSLSDVVAPAEQEYLTIAYSPGELGEHSVRVVITSNDPLMPTVQVWVRATAVFKGEPDIEVAYDGYAGPTVSNDCTADGDCVVPMGMGLEFGNIALGAQGTARLVLRNLAACAPFPGAERCSSCAVTVDKNPARHNVGLGFEEGTNDDGLFAFAGSTTTPFEILQRDVECGEPGELRLALTFQAPEEEGDHSTVVIIESNDPDESVIKVPVVAHVRNAPVAIADFRDYDVTNPSAPWSDADDLIVLSRIYFDGSESYDPEAPEDPSRITDYQWEVTEFPGNTNAADFAYEGQGTKYFSFWPPLAGDYTVSLRVTNVVGLASGDTDRSHVRLHVRPGSRLHVELTWDNSINDQDLHLTHASRDDTLCASSDCYYGNCTPTGSLGGAPHWYTDDAPRTGANPHLDIDDTHGHGPENININEPQPGTYRVYVHYYSGALPTTNMVRIWLNGLQVAEYRRLLSSVETVWAVADITWYESDTGTVTAYPSDSSGEVGALSSMSGCWSPWSFAEGL